jgi:RNA polymerase sigma-70 factor (ECF subfamily)
VAEEVGKGMTASEAARDEAQMIAAILGGESSLFHDLVRPYERTVYVMALSFMRNGADAEDVAQEAFLQAFRKLDTFRGEAKFGTWLISITLNEARGRIRRSKILKTESIDDSQDGDYTVSPALLRDWKEIPSECLERKEMQHLLETAIGDLPLIYREIFILRDVEEMSVAEAAEMLAISVASVKVRLHRARMMLQSSLAPKLKQMKSKRRRFP